jgi:acyl-coenzyme A synthetase/AMP-(fatty) acid ligase
LGRWAIAGFDGCICLDWHYRIVRRGASATSEVLFRTKISRFIAASPGYMACLAQEGMTRPMPIPMELLQASPLLGGFAHLDRLALIGADQRWTWRQVHLAASELARRLDKSETICNLCGSRVGFLVTWLAAMRRGCMQLLPPSGGHADLVAILQSCSRPTIVVDEEKLLQPQWTTNARCLINIPDATQRSSPKDVLSWQADWDLSMVRLYTSGSTGVPEPQTRTLGQLVQGAFLLGSRLHAELEGGLSLINAIVCSVPPQHMFGLEMSVMLSLVHGIPVLERRPLLPADVISAFEQTGVGTAWITTPLHLQALVRTGDNVPNCSVVVSSTMPLDPTVARHTEVLVKAPVLEIYGSTETGAIAMRRTAKDISWQPVDNVWIEPGIFGSGAKVWGSHFSSPQILTDQIKTNEHGRFNLLGRHGDMIKIGGRRASLAGLNLLLSNFPGLLDGVFYMPTTGAYPERLVLIHTGEVLDPIATVNWLRERMDPVFIPRTIIRTSSLGRTDTGKLSKAVLDGIYAGWRSERGIDEPV